MIRRYQLLGLSLLLLAIGATAGLAYLSEGAKSETHSIAFDRGADLADGAHATIEQIAARLAADDTLEAVITGHTGTIGSAEANHALSVDRAKRVRALVVETLQAQGDDAIDRIRAFGAGGSQPLPREDGESDRAHQRRLARATVELSVPLP